MDVTPTRSMFDIMKKIVDAFTGDEPHLLDTSAQASARRAMRGMAFELLHRLVGMAMREGVNRAIRDAQARIAGAQDGADRSAVSKAVDDAHADKSIIQMPTR